MKDIKRRVELFAFYDRCGMERHLENMANRGWMIEKITNFYWQYKKIAPAKIHFSITYFDKASGFDALPGAQQQEYWEYCLQEGWKLTASSAQMQIFCNEDENPKAIETEPMVQMENIQKTLKKMMLIFFFVIIISLIQIGFQINFLWNDPIDVLSGKMFFTQITLIGYIILICAVQLIGYADWIHKAKKTAENGEFYEKSARLWLQKLLFSILTILFIVYLFSNGFIAVAGFVMVCVILLLVQFGFKQIKKRQLSRKKNIAIVVILALVLSNLTAIGIFFGASRFFNFQKDTAPEVISSIPLWESDMGGKRDNYEIKAEQKETLFLKTLNYDDTLKKELRGSDEEFPLMTYRVTYIKVPYIYNLCLNGIFRKQEEFQADTGLPEEYRECDAKPWGAQKAYRLFYQERSQNTYTVCYEDRIAEIGFYYEPTGAQISRAGEKLSRYAL